MRSSVLFVHVPKTAGTSFRLGLEARVGAAAVCYDYGEQSDVTSALVRALVYEKPDLWLFKQRFDREGHRVLCGHFSTGKYVPLFGVLNTIAFLRDPVQRVLSEYHHFVRHNGYQHSLEHFIKQPHFINKQHKSLAEAPLSAYGFIGVAEHYSECLSMINQELRFDVPEITANAARSALDETHVCSAELEEEILELNARDVEIYRQAQWLLKRRKSALVERLPLTRGGITEVRNKSIRGWAFRSEERAPVSISIQVNGREAAQIQATEYRPALHGMGIGRGGYVGFSATVQDLKEGDEVNCVASDTEECLLHRPVVA